MKYAYCIGLILLLSSCHQQAETPTLPLPIASTPAVSPVETLLLYEGQGELEGHTWQVGEVTFSFQRGNHMLVRGGHLDETMPTGAPGRYTLDDQVLSLEVLGREYSGQWDKQKLTVNEQEGIYRGLTEVVFPEPSLEALSKTNDESGGSHEN